MRLTSEQEEAEQEAQPVGKRGLRCPLTHIRANHKSRVSRRGRVLPRSTMGRLRDTNSFLIERPQFRSTF